MILYHTNFILFFYFLIKTDPPPIDSKLNSFTRKTTKEIQELQHETFTIQEKEVENLQNIQKDLDHLQLNQRESLFKVQNELSNLENRTQNKIDQLFKNFELKTTGNKSFEKSSSSSESLQNSSDLQFFRKNIQQLVKEEVARQTQMIVGGEQNVTPKIDRHARGDATFTRSKIPRKSLSPRTSPTF